ncbi:Wzz/FepE/Etk N-terminal domain-containing protein [Iodobacter sp. CM08]|uniref:GumC family protein n=1 Tax=Iodobacter sp. CM08 TaxID=3085902 RepID=UPI002981739C|nr:Wzz/FepE/Etk N-terminal domain-containing protein [Iodobacter sp. CM08]MDW5416983.1 Wzz/FepE/Etk N-terminal domain-containing protein [Iodobacter sp. CM08]
MENKTVVQENDQDDEISLIDLLIVLAKHKKLIFGLPVLFAVLAVIYGLLATPIFEAKTTILPPQQQQSSASAMLAQLGGLGGAGAALGMKSPNDIYIAMMQSRRLEEKLVERFKLQTVYEAKTIGDTLAALEGSSKIATGKDGLISIAVEDKDPKLAAAIANAYVEELRNLSKVMAVTEAAQRRQFFEGQLLGAKKELANAEVALKQEQEKTGVLQLDAQGKMAIEALGALRAKVSAKQVQINAMRNFATESNPELQRAKAELDSLQTQLADMGKGGDANEDVLLAKTKAPGIGLEYIRKVRDVKYQETLFELMSKQYEIAKLDEAKDGANIQVLDAAIEPERKSKPKRAILVLLALFGGFFLAILASFILEAFNKMGTNPEQKQRLDLLKKAWKGIA